MTEPKFKNLNLFEHYEGFELTLGNTLTVEIYNVPFGLFSHILVRVIEEYPNYDYKTCTILKNEDLDYRVILVFKAKEHTSLNQTRVCF